MPVVPAPYTPLLQPHFIDLDEEGALHTAMSERVEGQLLTQGQPIPAMHLFRDGAEEIISWSELALLDPGASFAATWAALGQRHELLRRMVVLRLEQGEQRLVCMIEQRWERGQPGAWWLALRRYAEQNGIGRFTDPRWQVHRGVQALPSPFDGLLRPGPGDRPALLLPAQRPPAELWKGEAELPAQMPAPDHVSMVADHAQALAASMLLGEGLHHVVGLAFRGRHQRRFLFGDHLPADIDDLMRSLCQEGPAAEGAALFGAAVAQVDGRPTHVIRLRAEMRGEELTRAIVLRREPDGRMVPERVLQRDLRPVPEGEGWLTVPPLLAGELLLRPAVEETEH